MDTQVRSRATLTPEELTTRLHRQLSDQLDAVVDFADLCAYLAPAGSERAQLLIDLAQDLHDETLRVLGHPGPES